jgi:hypothetical protein
VTIASSASTTTTTVPTITGNTRISMAAPLGATGTSPSSASPGVAAASSGALAATGPGPSLRWLFVASLCPHDRGRVRLARPCTRSEGWNPSVMLFLGADPFRRVGAEIPVWTLTWTSPRAESQVGPLWHLPLLRMAECRDPQRSAAWTHRSLSIPRSCCSPLTPKMPDAQRLRRPMVSVRSGCSPGG